MEKINDLIYKSPNWKIFLMGTLIATLIFSGLFILMDALLKPVFDIPIIKLLSVSTFFGIMFGFIVSTMIAEIKKWDRYYNIIKPFKERAEQVETMVEWNNIKQDINHFHKNHELGKMRSKVMDNTILLMNTKKPYME